MSFSSVDARRTKTRSSDPTTHPVADGSPQFAHAPQKEPVLSSSKEAVEKGILQAIAYADIFDFPLTGSEVHHYLIKVPAKIETVQEVLQDGRLVPQHLDRRQNYFTLAGREHLVDVRRRRAAVAAKMWPQARHYGRIIAELPFVRMVALTGALAVDNVEADADIDYLVITAPDRLWLCRAVIILLVRLAARQGAIICPNYLLSERALVLEERNLYTAHELVQMVPIAGLPVYRRMRALNTWANRLLPNANGSLRATQETNDDGPRSRTGPTFRLQATRQRSARLLAEGLLNTPLGSWLERWEMERKVAKFGRQGHPDAEVAFCEDWCKGHFDSHGQHTLEAFARRLETLNL